MAFFVFTSPKGSGQPLENNFQVFWVSVNNGGRFGLILWVVLKCGHGGCPLSHHTSVILNWAIYPGSLLVTLGEEVSSFSEAMYSLNSELKEIGFESHHSR